MKEFHCEKFHRDTQAQDITDWLNERSQEGWTFKDTLIINSSVVVIMDRDKKLTKTLRLQK